MKNKKLFAIIFSVVLMIVAVSATLAVAADQAEGADTYTDETASSTEGENLGSVLPPYQEIYNPITDAKYFGNVAPLMNTQSLATLDDYNRDGNNSGVVLNKYVTSAANGGFTITLEAYATGVSHTESHYDPADIVLVLDTSGSMKYPMTDDGYEPVYGKITNNNGWPNTDRTDYTNQDGKGNTAKNAYSVTGHDSTVYNSNYYTYYIDVNGEKTQVWYYSGFGWATKANNFNGSTLNPNSTPYVPKTSADDNARNHVQFYRIKEDSTRLKALQDAANAFISNVLTTSPDSSIAIVNFGGAVNVAQGFSSNKTTLQNAVNGLTPTGATRADLGLQEANTLIDNLDDTHKDHKKVVIMFTDGVPTSNSEFEVDVANNAISNANSIKGGATVYTIGVFDGANGALSSFNSSDVNKYMHLVSSNYPDSKSMTDTGDINSELNGKSYYLSASNSKELMDIFELISNEVGGANNTTLGTETVIKDIIAPAFTVPANTSDIKIYTADCIGAGLTFGSRTEVTSGITTTINGDTLDVKGFDFSKNWCGDHSGTYSGKKLIIEFTVTVKDNFLGGNNVYTNGENSGIYGNSDATTPLATFPRPMVNIPIDNTLALTPGKLNVYLLGNITAQQIKDGCKASCGNVTLELGKDNFGLEDWQHEYVNISVEIKDAHGNTFSDLNSMKDDATYSITVTVTPKSNGEGALGDPAKGQTNTKDDAVNVFKPVLTFKDSVAYYGDNAPELEAHLTSSVWKHGDTTSTGVTMIGTEPELKLTYDPEDGKIKDGKIYTKKDIEVDVDIAIGSVNVNEYTNFIHTKCEGETSDPVKCKFWIHVKTCQLTVTKKGGNSGESYVFIVLKDGKKYTELTVGADSSVTIYELPVGTYSIIEDTTWSWRYTAAYDKYVELTSKVPSGEIVCTNTLENKYWLNGYSSVVVNRFGFSHN